MSIQIMQLDAGDLVPVKASTSAREQRILAVVQSYTSPNRALRPTEIQNYLLTYLNYIALALKVNKRF